MFCGGSWRTRAARWCRAQWPGVGPGGLFGDGCGGRVRWAGRYALKRGSALDFAVRFVVHDGDVEEADVGWFYWGGLGITNVDPKWDQELADKVES